MFILATRKSAIRKRIGIGVKIFKTFETAYIVNHKTDHPFLFIHNYKILPLGPHEDILSYQSKYTDFINSVCLDVLKMFG